MSESRDWIDCTIGEISKLQGGSAFKEEFQGNTTGEIPFIKVSDFNLSENEKYITRANNWVTTEMLKEMGARVFPEGSVVFPKVGAALLSNRRRILSRPTALDNNLMAAIPNGCRSDYLHLALCQIDFSRFVQEGAVPSVNQEQVASVELSLPPLPEQKKIAEILSGIDRSIQTESNMISKITKQYQGVLSQIFDDASKQIPLSDYLPLRDLGLDISDGNYSAKYPNASEFGERGVPFIRASNMRDGTIDDKDMRFISATKHQEITKGHLKSGDILIANRGEIGKTSRVPERHIGSNINAQVVRINGGKKIDSSFLFHYISSPFCQTLIDELTTGTALKQLPVGNLVKLLIPAPEVSVQIVIGGALDSMQRVMNTISEKIRKRSQLKQALATELLSGRKRVSV